MMTRLAHVAILNGEQDSVRKRILAILEKGMEDPRDNLDVKLYTLAIAADMRLQMGALSPGINWLAYIVSQTHLYGIPRVYAEDLFAR